MVCFQINETFIRDTFQESGFNPSAYKRLKTQTLRDSRATERLEKQKRAEQEKKRRRERQVQLYWAESLQRI